MRGFDGEIHQRTNRALMIAWLAALVGGAISTTTSIPVGLAIAGFGAIASVWYTPAAETVAIQYREYQRLEDGDRDV